MEFSELQGVRKNKYFTVQPLDSNVSMIHSPIQKMDLNILKYMNEMKDFISYSSRKALMEMLQETINIRIKDSENEQSNNGIGKVVLGIRGIGKSYILQNIAIHTGLCRPDLFVVYLNCEFIKMGLLQLLIEIAKERNIFDVSYTAESLVAFLWNLKQKNMTLVLFVDELQYMYPEPDVPMSDYDLQFKISVIEDICSLAGGGDSLIIAAGSSVTLADKAFHRVSSDTRVSKYPKLNDRKMVPITLLPIMEKEDFRNAFIQLKKPIEEKDINGLYLKTGGIIRKLRFELILYRNDHLPC